MQNGDSLMNGKNSVHWSV